MSAFFSRLIVAAEIVLEQLLAIVRFARCPDLSGPPFSVWASKEMGNENIFLSVTLDKSELHLKMIHYRNSSSVIIWNNSSLK